MKEGHYSIYQVQMKRQIDRFTVIGFLLTLNQDEKNWNEKHTVSVVKDEMKTFYLE